MWPEARPTQAVILAGGRGSRLRPLTDTMPKPMLEFHGKPFLAYLLELLREQGFGRVVLLLGYLPEVIRRYVGDGRRWGLDVAYVVSPVEDDTGWRLKLALPNLDARFLLCYCDNYWPLPFARMWRQFTEADTEAMITVYRNTDGYSRDNVQLDSRGRVAVYDKSRTAQHLRGVDIGFGVFSRQAVEALPDGRDVSFERAAYPALVARGQLSAFVTDHRYYSVSTPERLEATTVFLARRPAVILDRDGVLNARPPRAQYIRSWTEWQWLPGAQEALRLLAEAGYRVFLFSNQAGVARGVMSEQDVAAIHQRMLSQVEQAGGRIDAIYCCPHGWDSTCGCRKPKPGMLFQAQREHHLDLSRTYVLGDDERDGQAAEAAGCPWAQVSDARPLLDAVNELLERGAISPRSAVAVESS